MNGGYICICVVGDDGICVYCVLFLLYIGKDYWCFICLGYEIGFWCFFFDLFLFVKFICCD